MMHLNYYYKYFTGQAKLSFLLLFFFIYMYWKTFLLKFYEKCLFSFLENFNHLLMTFSTNLIALR